MSHSRRLTVRPGHSLSHTRSRRKSARVLPAGAPRLCRPCRLAESCLRVLSRRELRGTRAPCRSLRSAVSPSGAIGDGPTNGRTQAGRAGADRRTSHTDARGRQRRAHGATERATHRRHVLLGVRFGVVGRSACASAGVACDEAARGASGVRSTDRRTRKAATVRSHRTGKRRRDNTNKERVCVCAVV